MSIALICPGCQVATTFHRPPISACPNCQSAFPAALREPAEAALARQDAPQPILITIGRFVSPGVGVLSILGTLQLWSRVGGVIDQTTGEMFSSWDALTHGGLSLPLAGCVCIAIGIGIWEERPWSRHLMIAYWIMSFATGVGRATTINGLSVAMTTTLFIGIFVLAGWYLYAKENVVAYYKSLEMRGRVGVTRAPDDL